MRKNITIRSFLNEMSYELNQEELEKIVLKYQNTLIRFVRDNRFKAKKKDTFEEVCEKVSEARFIEAVERVGEKTDKLDCDMAHILTICTINTEDKLKEAASALAYKIRLSEFEDIIKDEKMLRMVSYLSCWTMRGYEPSEFYKIKEVNVITEKLPEILHCEFKDKGELPKEFFRDIYSILIPNIKPNELLSGMIRTPYQEDKKYVQYQVRLRTFIHQLVYYSPKDKVIEVFQKTFDDLIRFNNRTNAGITLDDLYISYDFVKKISSLPEIKHKNTDKSKGIIKTYQILNDMRKEDKYNELF